MYIKKEYTQLKQFTEDFCSEDSIKQSLSNTSVLGKRTTTHEGPKDQIITPLKIQFKKPELPKTLKP
jgi:hypothetical protein